MKTTGDEKGAFPLFTDEDAKKIYPTMAIDPKANGGTEMMARELYKRLDPELRDKFQFICSRVREIDPTRPTILWLHDLWNDPEVTHLQQATSRARFAKLVFVSDWQLSTYNAGLGVPYGDSVVIKNAIEPIPVVEKIDGPIRLIYHTTPHRGLELLVPVFSKIYDDVTKNIHLDVFSSFEQYGWGHRDEPYQGLFEFCKTHPAITYHGATPNADVRECLKTADIFAYPSIWQETSCIAAMEAMSAACHIVCPNYGALPETCAGFAHMYQWNEDVNKHASTFAAWLVNAIRLAEKERFSDRQRFQKVYADTFFNWDARAAQWTATLNNLYESQNAIHL